MRRRDYVERENRVYIADYTRDECSVKICPRCVQSRGLTHSHGTQEYSLFLFVNSIDLVFSYRYSTLRTCLTQSFIVNELTTADTLWQYAVSVHELPSQWKEIDFDVSQWSWKRNTFPLYQNDAVLYLRKSFDVGVPPVFHL